MSSRVEGGSDPEEGSSFLDFSEQMIGEWSS